MAPPRGVRFTPQGGGSVPALGYGTAHIHNVTTIVAALEAGFRHIDTAALYGNHQAVGEALRRSGIDRSKVFVTTKVSFLSKGGERLALRASLAELGLKQVDLCLLHTPLTNSWPELAAAYLPHRLGRFQPLSWGPLRALAGPARRLLGWLNAAVGTAPAEGAAVRRAAWRELQAARAAGACRFIGVSNFDAGLLAELAAGGGSVPAVNQVELHPRFQARETLEYCRARGIAVFGYGNGLSLDLPQAAAIAESRGGAVTPAQVALAWTLQAGAGAIVRSSRPMGMRHNLAAADITLTEAEMAAMSAAGEDEPFYWDAGAVAREGPAGEGGAGDGEL